MMVTVIIQNDGQNDGQNYGLKSCNYDSLSL